jgi:hypothetical protein
MKLLVEDFFVRLNSDSEATVFSNKHVYWLHRVERDCDRDEEVIITQHPPKKDLMGNNMALKHFDGSLWVYFAKYKPWLRYTNPPTELWDQVWSWDPINKNWIWMKNYFKNAE